MGEFMIDGIMTKLGLKKIDKTGEAARVKKDEPVYTEKSPDKLVRSPNKDTFTSSKQTDNKKS